MWATVLRTRNPSCAWCHEATLADPQVSVKVYAHFPAGGGQAWEEVEVVGTGWREKVERLRALPSVLELAVLESTPEHARLRLRVEACPLAAAVAASGVLPRFPFEVRAGREEWTLIGGREENARFVAALREGGADVEVASMREHHPHGSLTPRQRHLMEAAIEQGYYEVPRRVTLTALAQRLHVAKSTLSEALARAERHVLEDLREGAA